MFGKRIIKMQRKLVLIDFDGVVLKNKKSARFVKIQNKKYVAKKLDGVYNHKQVAEELYKHHGHTTFGLNWMGIQSSLHEYNRHIYDNIPNELTMTKQETYDFEQFMNTMNQADIDVKLFSNAPVKWIQHFIAYDQSLYAFSDHIMRFRGSRMYNNLIKPNQKIYDMININYCQEYNDVFFIDDKFINFKWKMNWNNIWMNEKHQKEQKYTEVNSLQQAAEIILHHGKV